MQYHIQTTPIWDAFKSDCQCPLCSIYEKTASRLVLEYLNEAVMEPDYRVEVNKYGFCSKHLTELFAGKNKLGLALQLNTRTQKIIGDIKACSNIKQALKLAESLEETIDTCVICSQADEMMTRYAYTVAQMYDNEKDFAAILNNSKGFCMPHFILLLKNSKRAGKSIEKYLEDLVSKQKNSLSQINSDTELFTQRFDYRNAGSSVGAGTDTVKNAINKLKGTIIK